MSCIIYTTLHDKEFSFKEHYIHCIMDRFGNDFLFSLQMCNIDVTILFLTLALNMMSTVSWLLRELLWQPLITKTNDYTSNKSLRADIKWEFHKRTWQGASAKLESYIYKVHMVHATSSCPPYFLLKATMLYSYILTLSFRSFHHVLGLWHHTMWSVMWLQCYVPLYRPKEKKKKKKNNIKSEK